MSVLEKREKSLAEAVAILIEEIHKSFPAVSTCPIPPYEDEDFTLEVKIPVAMDREQVMDACINHALKIEDQFGFTILTRIKSLPDEPKRRHQSTASGEPNNDFR
ncbi:MAG: hypothetical protein HY673_03440 [Chloroflexi bacterium]|nr:hypothetical protein [Chloroflexota bacterium]